MAFLVKLFSGMMPRLSPRLIDSKTAQKAVNTKLTSGALVPINNSLLIGAGILSNPGIKKTIYRYGNDIQSEALYWFNFTKDTSIVRGNVFGDVEERIYFSGSVNTVINMWVLDANHMWTTDAKLMWNQNGFLSASMTYKSIALSGSNYPANHYALGIPQPSTIPTLAVSSPAISSITRAGTLATATTALAHGRTTGDSIVIQGAAQSQYNGTFTITVTGTNTFTYVMASDPGASATGTLTYYLGGLKETRVYGITYVSGVGEEGIPVITALIDAYPGQIVTISSLPGAPVGNYNIAKLYIYRLATGSNASTLRYVDSVAIGVTTYSDSKLTSQLAENCPSLNYNLPPNELSGLIDIQNGIMAGISADQVCFTQPYQPHAWPTAYRYSFATNPVAIGAFGQSIVVLTNGMPSLLTGTDPSNMSQDVIKHGHPCMSSQSVVEVKGGIAWASDEGIAFIDNQGFRLLTSSHFTKKEWANYYPETIRAYRYRDSYVGFYDAGTFQAGFVFDIATQEFYELDFYTTAAFTDPRNGNLYLADGDNVVKFDEGLTSKTMIWHSGVHIEPRPVNMGIAKVIAEGYPVSFKLYANKQLKYTKSVFSQEPFRLPPDYLETDFEFEIASNFTVNSVAAAENIDALKDIAE